MAEWSNAILLERIIATGSGGGGVTRPLPMDRGGENFMETQQSGHAPRSGPKS